MKTYPLFIGLDFSHSALPTMFLRNTVRKQDSKIRRFFSVVENRRLQGARTVQRTVSYLGEIDDTQQAGWRKTLTVLDEQDQDYRTVRLFPNDRVTPPPMH